MNSPQRISSPINTGPEETDYSSSLAQLAPLMEQYRQDLKSKVAPGECFNPISPVLVALIPHVQSCTRAALIEGLFGAESAQSLYEANRIFHYSTLPELAQREVASILQNAFARVDMRLAIRQIDPTANKRDHFTKPPMSLEPVLRNFSLDGLLSYQTAQLFSDQLSQQCQSSANYGVELRETGPGRFKVDVVFSPSLAGVIGREARQALRSILTLMHRANLAVDLFAALDLELSAPVLRAILRDPRDPWKMLEIREVRNQIALHQAFNDEYPEATQEQRQWAFANLLGSRAPLRRLAEKLRPTPEVSSEAEATAETPTLKRLDYRTAFIEGIAGLLRQGYPELADLKQVSRRFYALHARGCSYTEIAAVLLTEIDKAPGERRSPFDLAEEIYLARLRGVAPSTGQKPAISVEVVPPKDDPEPESSTIAAFEPAGGSSFSKWFEGLDTDSKRVIGARLFRVEQGNFGDYDRVARGKEPLFELRWPGKRYDFRIYFCLPSPNEVVVLYGGTKDTQERDIRRALELYQEYQGMNGGASLRPLV
ncbi:MAG: type II toxin-antitoxin system RelE/ParE family toxin [Oligoflexia bacterium]|nr:type II toxin-antitoxin system RelE/ParE family toxin [Oligoflexia bacterium]